MRLFIACLIKWNKQFVTRILDCNSMRSIVDLLLQFTKRWNAMNIPLHMLTCALNPKWHAPRPSRMLPSEADEVMEGLTTSLCKMYSNEQATILQEQWLQFADLQGPIFSKPEARTDRAITAQKDPICDINFMGRTHRSWNNLPFIFFHRLLVPLLKRGIGPPMTSSTPLRETCLPQSELKN